jgi:hypothetical protein
MAYTTTTKLGIKKPVPGSAQPFETSVFNESYDKIDNEFVAVDGRLDTIEGQNLDSRLTTVETDTSTNDSRLTTLEGQSLDTRLTTAEADIINNDGRLDTLEGHNLNTRLTTAEGEIDSIQTVDQQQNQRLAVLEIATGNPPVDFAVDGGTP